MNRFARTVAPMMLLFSLSICLSAQTPTDWRFTPLLSESPLTLANGSSVYPGLPVMSGNTLTFAGYKPDFFDPSGIYQSNSGTITKIADTRTRIPNDGRRFDHFGGSLIANGDQVAFTGAPTSNGGEGVYLSQSGNLSVIADSSTTLPGSTSKLASAYFADSRNNINSERLLFNAFGNGTNGLYSREKNGSLIRIADNSMLAPGTNTPFRSFVDAQMSGNQIAFMNNAGGNDVGRGAYLSVNGVITTIANGTTQVPETDFLFKTVYEAALSEKRQVIAGRYSDGKRLRYGLYENTSNGLIPLLDPNTLLPPDANYTYLPARLLASDDTLAFSVYSQTPEGGIGFYEPLFVNRGGITEKLLQRGDTLDGKTVSFFYPLQFDSGRLLMQVSFTDNSRGYFSAQAVPEPGAVAWLIVVSMGSAGSVWWKRFRKLQR